MIELLLLGGLYLLTSQRSAVQVAQSPALDPVPTSYVMPEYVQTPAPSNSQNQVADLIQTAQQVKQVLGSVQEIKGTVTQIVKAVTGATTAGETVAGTVPALSGTAPLAPSAGSAAGSAAGGSGAGAAEVAGSVGGGTVALVGLGLLAGSVYVGNLLLGKESRPGSDMKYGEEAVLNPAEYNKGLFESGVLKTGGGSVSVGGGKINLGRTAAGAAAIIQANQ